MTNYAIKYFPYYSRYLSIQFATKNETPQTFAEISGYKSAKVLNSVLKCNSTNIENVISNENLSYRVSNNCIISIFRQASNTYSLTVVQHKLC